MTGLDKNLLCTAEGVEALAAQSVNPETKATFLEIAGAYRQLARQQAKHRSGFPSWRCKAGSSSLPLIRLGQAWFHEFPSNESGFGVVRGDRWVAI
jgi:hypothetical protein